MIKLVDFIEEGKFEPVIVTTCPVCGDITYLSVEKILNDKMMSSVCLNCSECGEYIGTLKKEITPSTVCIKKDTFKEGIYIPLWTGIK